MSQEPEKLYRSRAKHQLVIPYTSPEMYISGHHALNIPDSDKNADWHPEIFYYDPIVEEDEPLVRLAGLGQEMNTNSALGTWGVYDAKDRIKCLDLEVTPGVSAVYVANHARAVLDLLAFEIQNNGRPTTTLAAIDNWIDPADQYKTLGRAVDLMSLVEPNILKEWIDIQNEHIKY